MLIGVNLAEAAGETRSQNMPGTMRRRYPNWRLPLCGPDGAPVLLEDLRPAPRPRRRRSRGWPPRVPKAPEADVARVAVVA